MSNDVLKLFEGLNRKQVQALSAQALPVLRELRRAIETDQKTLIIELLPTGKLTSHEDKGEGAKKVFIGEPLPGGAFRTKKAPVIKNLR